MSKETPPAPDLSIAENPATSWRKFLRSPIAFWSAAGLCFVAFQAVIFSRWISDGGLHAMPSGGYEISTTQKIVTWAVQAAVTVGAIIVAVILLKASRREGRPTFLALLYLGLAFTVWANPIANYGDVHVSQNRYALNVATWGPYIPGWESSYVEEQAEVFISATGLGYMLCILWAMIPIAIFDRMGGRESSSGMARWSLTHVIIATVAVGAVLEAILDPIWVKTGAGYAYAGVGQTFTVFSGHWYQFPLANILVFPLVLSLPPVLMIWKSRRTGRDVWILQGREYLPRRTCNWVSLGAAIGLANVMVLLALMLSLTLWGNDAFPTDMPSYLQVG
ncbi:spirocyclase AveC family protein [Streptomyces pathocidini]|uniref:spirocyclase AveC family protein n=1 Tax=Streptomyces pathocidini TaxID=1650571 RepID=UPI0033CFB166